MVKKLGFKEISSGNKSKRPPSNMFIHKKNEKIRKNKKKIRFFIPIQLFNHSQ